MQVLTSFAAMAMQPVVVMVAGHLGEVELAAVALSNSVSGQKLKRIRKSCPWEYN